MSGVFLYPLTVVVIACHTRILFLRITALMGMLSNIISIRLIHGTLTGFTTTVDPGQPIISVTAIADSCPRRPLQDRFDSPARDAVRKSISRLLAMH
ncbi:hypothetical protein GGI42DRAFT_91030 [Trichoderma sp. SZMC 28013]